MLLILKNMKISSKKLIVIIGLIILAALIFGIVFWGIVSYNSPFKKAQQQVENYNQYQVAEEELVKVKKGEGGFIYYYAVDNKRYVFPTNEVFSSWFGDYSQEEVRFEDLETMYQTALGGNVTFRPGTLIKSLTIPKTFIVVKNGKIRPFADESLIEETFGSFWQDKVYALPDYYFSQYEEGEPIKSFKDFPTIPKEITIDLDKGLK